VNVDLPSEELIQRLKDGKIYPTSASRRRSRTSFARRTWPRSESWRSGSNRRPARSRPADQGAERRAGDGRNQGDGPRCRRTPRRRGSCCDADRRSRTAQHQLVRGLRENAEREPAAHLRRATTGSSRRTDSSRWSSARRSSGSRARIPGAELLRFARQKRRHALALRKEPRPVWRRFLSRDTRRRSRAGRDRQWPTSTLIEPDRALRRASPEPTARLDRRRRRSALSPGIGGALP